jgi:site-specific DNA-methyltransferase (adenine-specific)
MHRIISGDVLRFASHYRGPKFHAVLCDPPYEMGFMGKSWDSRGVSFRAETWSAVRSLLAPGAHLLAFGGTRTFHRIAIAIEDAGFEIRDTLGWLYGSGFPKSHDVSKAIDREAGAVRSEGDRLWSGGVRAGGISHGGGQSGTSERLIYDTPATDAARAWQGYGTALKPAWEPVIVARNPLVGTVAQNVQGYGAGALNIDGGRVGDEGGCRSVKRQLSSNADTVYGKLLNAETPSPRHEGLGRWPANIIHDGSDEVTEVLGDAQRFFYCAKAGKREREEVLSGFEVRVAGAMDARSGRSGALDNSSGDGLTRGRNHHPTVKPIALTEYLARIILPAAVVGDRRILVPFAGSGSECIGAMLAGWETIIGVEREDEYVRIARARMEYHGTKRD